MKHNYKAPEMEMLWLRDLEVLVVSDPDVNDLYGSDNLLG